MSMTPDNDTPDPVAVDAADLRALTELQTFGAQFVAALRPRTPAQLADIVMAAMDAAVAEVRAERAEEARELREIRQAAADPGAEGLEPPPLPPLAAAAELMWTETDARAVAHSVVLRLVRAGVLA